MPRTRKAPAPARDQDPEPQAPVPVQDQDQDQDQDQGKAPAPGADVRSPGSAAPRRKDPDEDLEDEEEGEEDEEGEEEESEEDSDEDSDEESDEPGEEEEEGWPGGEEDQTDLERASSPGPSRKDPGEKADSARKRGRPPKERISLVDFLKVRDAAREIGARVDQLRVWAEGGQIPGIRYHQNGLLIPRPWIDSVLDGSVMAPDNIVRVREKKAHKEKKEEPVKTSSTAGGGRNQEVLNKLQSLYGTDSDLKVELSRRGPAGYAYLQDMPHPPSKAELQGLFPEGGDFQLRIFRSGKVVDEVSGVIVDAIDGTPYDPSQAYRAGGGFRRPPGARPGFVGRPPFDPGAPPGFRPSERGGDGIDYLAKKAADFAFETASGHRGGNGSDAAAILQTVTEQSKVQYESLARSIESERQRAREREIELEKARREDREEAEQRRREEKEELESALEAQRQDFENQKKIEMEKFKLEQEHMMTREREHFERAKAAEQERTKAMLDSQNQFFSQMRELDKKRDEITRDAHKEALALQERMMNAQRDAIEEQRRANDRMFEFQMAHVSEMKNSGEPLTAIAAALGKGLEKIGPMVQSRMTGMNPGYALASVPPRVASPEGGEGTGGDAMFNLMSKIKTQPMFVEELEAVADKIGKKIHPAFTVNKLLGMMQFDPSVSIILDYVVSTDIREVIKGVRLSPGAAKILSGAEADGWWKVFQAFLQQTMIASLGQAPPPQAPSGPAPQEPPAGPSLNQGL